MQTTQCPRCRHTFLSYAAECPECGLPRPRRTRSKWGPWAAVIATGLAVAAVVMVLKGNDQNEPPASRGQASARHR